MDSAKVGNGWPIRLWASALVATIGLGVIMSAAVSTLGEENSTAGHTALAPDGPAIALPGPATPLLQGGEVATRQRAAAIVGYAIPIPADQLASEATLTEIWAQSDTDEVALRFSTGIRIYLAKWPAGKNPGESLARQAEEAEAGWVETVGGHPVWVLPKNAQDEGFPPQANVTMVTAGVEVNIWGDVSTDQLLRIAATLVEA